MLEKEVPLRERIVLDKADLLSVCEAVCGRRDLTTHDGIDSRQITLRIEVRTLPGF
jgi:hypothetical protein